MASSSLLWLCSSNPLISPATLLKAHPRFPIRHRFRCSLVEPLMFENGKPHFPLLTSDPAFPTFLSPNSHFQNDINKHDTRLRIFSGTANPALAQEIACYMGLELGKIKIKRFADGEIYVQLQESVRGCDVFLVQPTCPPANENLMELLIMIDACRRASAKNITAVIPYFGYARADRKTQGRESIAAKLVANLITEAGANRVLACDLHSGQSMGYFDIPVDHVYGQPVILDYLASKTICSDDLVVVSPDVGGVARARAFAKKLSDAPLAIVDKRRHGHNVAEIFGGATHVNVSHMIHDLSFGPKYPGLHNPLDGTVRILHETSGTFKYYIKIVPTEYRYIWKEVLPTNQFSVSEYFSPMKEYDRSWPAVYFLYDLSPITVTIKEERRSFLHFITRLCAVLGGTFALTGMLDRWMYRLIEEVTKASGTRAYR